MLVVLLAGYSPKKKKKKKRDEVTRRGPLRRPRRRPSRRRGVGEVRGPAQRRAGGDPPASDREVRRAGVQHEPERQAQVCRRVGQRREAAPGRLEVQDGGHGGGRQRRHRGLQGARMGDPWDLPVDALGVQESLNIISARSSVCWMRVQKSYMCKLENGNKGGVLVCVI